MSRGGRYLFLMLIIWCVLKWIASTTGPNWENHDHDVLQCRTTKSERIIGGCGWLKSECDAAKKYSNEWRDGETDYLRRLHATYESECSGFE